MHGAQAGSTEETRKEGYLLLGRNIFIETAAGGAMSGYQPQRVGHGAGRLKD
jgi:hypothetical protein